MSDNDSNNDDKKDEYKGFNIPKPQPGQYNPPPPPPKRNPLFSGFVMLLIFAGIIIIPVAIFIFGIGGALGSSGSTQGSSVSHFQEQVVDAGKSEDKIVKITIHGIILSGNQSMFGNQVVASEIIIQQLQMAAKDEKVKIILLDMNTPGGEVIATDEIYHEMMKIRKEGKIKIVTCMRTVAASGGYYLAAGSDYIIANRMTMTGSIGVMMPGYNYHGLLQKIGVQTNVYKSGELKDIGSGARDPKSELSKKEREVLQRMVSEMFLEFASIVAKGRNLPLATVTAPPIGDARVLSGKEAKQLKLIDELGYFEDAVKYARKGGDYTMVEYVRPLTLMDALLGAKHEQKKVTVQLLPFSPQMIKPGQFYFLSPFAY
ncbi:MAG: signal peptide peptidase SppA [Lentisphaeria bacterium]|nr:signal peptide peptidase SppA [Lentisphaeria bacterium]